jgi:chromosome segregation ATPase
MFYKRRYLELKEKYDTLKADYSRTLSAAAAIEKAIATAEARLEAAERIIKIREAEIEKLERGAKEFGEKAEANLNALQAKLAKARSKGKAAEKQQGLIERLDECFGNGLSPEEAKNRGAYFAGTEKTPNPMNAEPSE